MRFCYTFLALGCLLLVGSARAQTYVEFFEIGGNPTLHGLDYHDGFLWVAVRSSSDPRILQVDPVDGEVLSTVSISASFTPLGVTWDGTDFWVSESFTSTPELFRVGTDGSILGQIDAPSQLSNGLAWRADTLWVANAFPDDQASLVGVDTTDGSVLGEIPFPSTQPAGIAFLGDGTLWTTNVGDDSGSDIEVLWKLDRATGAVLDTLEMPTGAGRPRGLAYDGSQFLFAVMDEPGGFDDVIYKIDLATDGTPVYTDNVDVLDWGLQDNDLPVGLTFTITNAGDAPLEISEQTISGDVGFTLDGDGEAFTLAAAADTSLGIFALAPGYGPLEATLSFATNDVANATVEIPLRALGVFSKQRLGFAEDAHDFGAVRIEDPYGGGRSEVLWPLQLINQGNGTLDVSDLVIDDEAFNVFSGDTPLSLATADTALIQIAFAPPEAVEYEATVTVTSNDFEMATRTVMLSGEGIDPDIEGGDALWTYALPDNPATSFQDKKISTLKSMGDVTGDGKADLVLGSENYFVLALNGNGWGTADTLWAFNTCYNNFDCGSVGGNLGVFETGLATGADFNRDGVGDVVFAVDGGGDRVTALDGRDGSIIWSLDTPDDPFLASYNAVAVRFDATGDGVPDVATCTGTASESPDPFNERRVYLLDGATGDEIWQAAPGIPNFIVSPFEAAGGQQLVAAGGRDENEVAHVTAYNAANGSVAWTTAPQIAPFVMAPYPLTGGGEDLIYAGLGNLSGGGGLARVDGATGDEVWSNYSFGTSVWDVVVLDDINDNGAPDLALGSVLDNTYVLDGATGEVLWSTSLGGQVFDVAAVADVNGDGLAEVAATGGAGNAVLLSGADGEELWSYRIGNGSLDQSGEVIVAVPDIDGNGFPEVGVATRHGRVALISSTGDFITDVSDESSLPTSFTLDQNFPNPFRTRTTVRYTLAERADVQLTIYNMLGQRIRTLVSEEQAAGVQSVVWDGHGTSGRLAAGVYLVRLQAGAFTETRRMVLLR